MTSTTMPVIMSVMMMAIAINSPWSSPVAAVSTTRYVTHVISRHGIKHLKILNPPMHKTNK